VARLRRVAYSQRYRQPGLWNTLRFQLALHSPFNPFRSFPMSSRRNSLIRTVAAVCGDVAIGAAVASACVWLIEAAALGLFLSFLLWLAGALAALALSQYVVHPVARLVLSDRKLDDVIGAMSGLTDAAEAIGGRVAEGLARYLNPALDAATRRMRKA
jgi:hypothetical protein